jgi:hypothetical protein
VRALKLKAVTAACAEWCDVDASLVTAGGNARPTVRRARRLALMVLVADGRSGIEAAGLMGLSQRSSVRRDFLDCATEEDRMDAKEIEQQLRSA